MKIGDAGNHKETESVHFVERPQGGGTTYCKAGEEAGTKYWPSLSLDLLQGPHRPIPTRSLGQGGLCVQTLQASLLRHKQAEEGTGVSGGGGEAP